MNGKAATDLIIQRSLITATCALISLAHDLVLHQPARLIATPRQLDKIHTSCLELSLFHRLTITHPILRPIFHRLN